MTKNERALLLPKISSAKLFEICLNTVQKDSRNNHKNIFRMNLFLCLVTCNTVT